MTGRHDLGRLTRIRYRTLLPFDSSGYLGTASASSSRTTPPFTCGRDGVVDIESWKHVPRAPRVTLATRLGQRGRRPAPCVPRFLLTPNTSRPLMVEWRNRGTCGCFPALSNVKKSVCTGASIPPLDHDFSTEVEPLLFLSGGSRSGGRGRQRASYKNIDLDAASPQLQTTASQVRTTSPALHHELTHTTVHLCLQLDHRYQNLMYVDVFMQGA